MSPSVSAYDFFCNKIGWTDYKEISNWGALAYLADALHEPYGSKLIEIYHNIWHNQPFRVYICCLEDLWRGVSL